MAKCIYLIDILNSLEIVGGFLIIIYLSILFASSACLLFAYEEKDEKMINLLLKIIKNKVGIGVAISAIALNIFIPSKETMYAMLLTDKVLTQENFIKTTDEAKKFIDYTVDKIKEVKEK